MILPYLTLLLFMNLAQGIPTGLFSETIPIFLSDIPNQYSITQSQIYQKSKMTQNIPKNYFVKEHQKGQILPLIPVQNPLQPTVSVGTSVDVHNDKKQGSQKNQISSRLVALGFNQDKRIKFKISSSVSLQKIAQYKIIGESSPILQTPFQQNSRNDEEKSEQEKPQNLQYGNQQQIKYFYVGLLFLAIVVVIFGFSEKKKSGLKPVITVDVDEEHPEVRQSIEDETQQIIEQNR